MPKETMNQPAEKKRIGLVSWGDPMDPDLRVYWGLRINGAYLGRPGAPVLWATRAEAMKAKRTIAAGAAQ